MGIMEIGKVSVTRLAEKCGTPLLIYDEEKIENKIKSYMRNFSSPLFQTEVVYASKAFGCPAMIEKVKDGGASLDVVSGGELYIAKVSGMNMEKVYFHGNNKTSEEISTALEFGCGNIVADNLEEFRTIIETAACTKRKINLMLRINPKVAAHTHEYTVTAAEDSKFGVSIDHKEKIAVLIKTAADKKVTFKGFHSHIGSQIFEASAFIKAAGLMIGLCSYMEKEHDIPCPWLSLGGGFGIKYTAEDDPPETETLCRELIRGCEEAIRSAGVKTEKIMIEPGRSIAGDAGCTVYKVGYEKIAGDKRYLFVDGGMGDNIRPALYGAEYPCDLAEHMGDTKDKEYVIGGKYCESGDIIIRKAMLPEAKKGDLLIVYSTGAYAYSMSSCYNGTGRPAVVFVKDGRTRLVMRREKKEDLMYLAKDQEVKI
ncbi:MAG TPA: diaminopimelate decarboxylase [Bacillota bacterium]|nr:diaminopimelate decarboxylase [Bacillota bacterium]